VTKRRWKAAPLATGNINAAGDIDITCRLTGGVLASCHDEETRRTYDSCRPKRGNPPAPFRALEVIPCRPVYTKPVADIGGMPVVRRRIAGLKPLRRRTSLLRPYPASTPPGWLEGRLHRTRRTVFFCRYQTRLPLSGGSLVHNQKRDFSPRLVNLVEMMGLEPTTSALRTPRSPS
jgi:hypothetical protein